MASKVVHFEVTGRDGAGLQRFFSELFGWKVDTNNPMSYGTVDGAEAGIGGGISGSEDGAPQVTFYVEVDDPQSYLEKAERLGGKVVMPMMDVPGGPTIAQLATAEGHVIGLVKAGTS